MEEFLEEWLKNKYSETSPKTYKQYKSYIVEDIIPELGGCRLVEVRVERINAFYRKLLENRGVPTVKYIHRVLRAALQDAVNAEYIASNPAKKAIKIKKESAQGVKGFADRIIESRGDDDSIQPVQPSMVFTEDEVNQFLVVAKSSGNFAFYQLALTTGMRESELFGLQNRYLKLGNDGGKVQVRQQVQWLDEDERTGRKAGWYFLSPKTTSGFREINISENIVQSLKEHLEKVNDRKAAKMEKGLWHEYDLVFPSLVGTPKNASNMRKEYNQLLEKAGLRRIRFHDLRHTVASILICNNIPVSVVSYIMGHSSVSFTLKTYIHFLPKTDAGASDLMGKIGQPNIIAPQLIQ